MGYFVCLYVKSFRTEQRLLFEDQNANQKRLLHRYGNEICFLVATHKTTKYANALFFLAVKRNVDHQVAGSFAVLAKTTDAFSEAVSILKK